MKKIILSFLLFPAISYSASLKLEVTLSNSEVKNFRFKSPQTPKEIEVNIPGVYCSVESSKEDEGIFFIDCGTTAKVKGKDVLVIHKTMIGCASEQQAVFAIYTAGAKDLKQSSVTKFSGKCD